MIRFATAEDIARAEELLRAAGLSEVCKVYGASLWMVTGRTGRHADRPRSYVRGEPSAPARCES